MASGGVESAAEAAKTPAFRQQATTVATAARPSVATTCGVGILCLTVRRAEATLKWLSIVDEHTRECLALKAARSITSEDVIDTLAELFAMRGVPRHIRSDNGPEFIAAAIRRWLGQVGVEALYIEPGSPWENGYAESFHSRLRDEFLAMEMFESLPAARALTAAWREDYNHDRPHSSLGYLTPAEFAAACAASAPASATPRLLQQHTRRDEEEALPIPQSLPS